VIIGGYLNEMKTLVDFATITSFLTAPVLAWINLKTLQLDHVPPEYRPKRGEVIWSWVGIGYLILFSIVFIYWKLSQPA
jgi:Mn2+/Fe2+ NRAMP family transporter